uniref:Uncharacterized protein n=1 Tax=Mycena chlorophos TaxID=658473 RepID=A0ABQ0LXC5_MYCCL|nr:predicted protein [Mycena chlorophos]
MNPRNGSLQGQVSAVRVARFAKSFAIMAARTAQTLSEDVPRRHCIRHTPPGWSGLGSRQNFDLLLLPVGPSHDVLANDSKSKDAVLGWRKELGPGLQVRGAPTAEIQTHRPPAP